MQGIVTNLYLILIFNLRVGLERKIFSSYLSLLLRSATNIDALSNEKRQMLSNLLSESEEYINEPGNTVRVKVHRDELIEFCFMRFVTAISPSTV